MTRPASASAPYVLVTRRSTGLRRTVRTFRDLDQVAAWIGAHCRGGANPARGKWTLYRRVADVDLPGPTVPVE